MIKRILFVLTIFILIFTTAGCGEETVIELSGDNSKKSGVFEIKTNNAKMQFTVEGGDTLAFAVFVIPEGETFEDNILTPNAKATEPTSDTIDLGKEPGKYFLQVTSLSADWSVKIIEQR